MQNAPSVSYPVGRFALAGVWLVGTVVLVVALQAGAWWGWWPTGAWVLWRWSVATGVWLLALGWAFVHWWRMPKGWLTWDPLLEPPEADNGGDTQASGWWWGAPSGLQAQALTKVQRMWMGQGWGLLRVRLQGAGHPKHLWLCVQASAAPERWLAVRRALNRHAA